VQSSKFSPLRPAHWGGEILPWPELGGREGHVALLADQAKPDILFLFRSLSQQAVKDQRGRVCLSFRGGVSETGKSPMIVSSSQWVQVCSIDTVWSVVKFRLIWAGV
jgi:hypothetical protein